MQGNKDEKDTVPGGRANFTTVGSRTKCRVPCSESSKHFKTVTAEH